MLVINGPQNLFDFIAVNRYPTIDVTIPNGFGIVIPNNLEIASGKSYTLDNNAVLEIS